MKWGPNTAADPKINKPANRKPICRFFFTAAKYLPSQRALQSGRYNE